jgi:hypothetical protein
MHRRILTCAVRTLHTSYGRALFRPRLPHLTMTSTAVATGGAARLHCRNTAFLPARARCARCCFEQQYIGTPVVGSLAGGPAPDADDQGQVGTMQ